MSIEKKSNLKWKNSAKLTQNKRNKIGYFRGTLIALWVSFIMELLELFIILHLGCFKLIYQHLKQNIF